MAVATDHTTRREAPVFTTADVATVLTAARTHNSAAAAMLTDARYDLARGFAFRWGYLEVVGQYVGVTRRGRRWLRNNA